MSAALIGPSSYVPRYDHKRLGKPACSLSGCLSPVFGAEFAALWRAKARPIRPSHPAKSQTRQRQSQREKVHTHIMHAPYGATANSLQSTAAGGQNTPWDWAS